MLTTNVAPAIFFILSVVTMKVYTVHVQIMHANFTRMASPENGEIWCFFVNMGIYIYLLYSMECDAVKTYVRHFRRWLAGASCCGRACCCMAYGSTFLRPMRRKTDLVACFHDTWRLTESNDDF